MASSILNTTLSFGLVEFPVTIKKATERKDVTFERAGPGGRPIVRHEVEDGGTGEALTAESIQRGVFVGDEFRPIKAEAIEEIAMAGQLEGIEIEDFVPARQVREELLPRVQASYYLCPQRGLLGAKPLKLLHNAMKLERVAGVARFCLKKSGGRQKLGVILPENGKLFVIAVAYAGDFRQSDEAAEAIANVEVNRDHLAAARELIAARRVERSALLDAAEDPVVAEKERLLEEALADKPVKARKRAKPRVELPVDDTMARLEASIEQIKRERKVTA